MHSLIEPICFGKEITCSLRYKYLLCSSCSFLFCVAGDGSCYSWDVSSITGNPPQPVEPFPGDPDKIALVGLVQRGEVYLVGGEEGNYAISQGYKYDGNGWTEVELYLFYINLMLSYIVTAAFLFV